MFDKGEGISQRPDNTSGRLGTIGVSGSFLVIDALGATMSEGYISIVNGSSTGARVVDGSRIRETVSEREACEEESVNILRKVRQEANTWNQQRRIN